MTTTRHLTDDELVLQYYGELAAAEEKSAAAHLSECTSCRDGFTRLRRVLEAVDEAAFVPATLPDGFERTVWARLEPNLRRDRPRWSAWLTLSPAPLALAATVVLLVAAAFFAGSMLPRVIDDGGPGAAGDQVRERILLIDLGEHLDRSQAVLVELVSADPDQTIDISSERARAEQLLSANRLYRQTAEATGDAGVIALLEELERVLVDVAAGPEQAAPHDLDDVRRRIESRGLLFKVRVVSSQVRERQKEAVQQRTGQRS